MGQLSKSLLVYCPPAASVFSAWALGKWFSSIATNLHYRFLLKWKVPGLSFWSSTSGLISHDAFIVPWFFPFSV